MPYLNRICRKLNIDCAAAVVGFDAHGGFSHAVYDGWVICEEFKEVVVAAFREEEIESAKRMIQKNQERILGNWANLVKMVLLREKLKKKYENKKSLINSETALNKNDAKKLLNLDDEIKVGAKLNRLEESKDKQEEDENEPNNEETEIEKPVILSKAKKRNRAKTSTQTNKRKTKAKKKKVSPSASEEEENNDDEDTNYEDQEVDDCEEDFKPIKRSNRTKRVVTRKKNKPSKYAKKNDDVEMDSIEEDESSPKNGRLVLEIGKVISLPKRIEDDDVKLSESDDE